MRNDRLVLGLDFGGTKLAAGIVNLTDRRLVASARLQTTAEGGARRAVAEMIALARTLEHDRLIDAIGVSFGGHVHANQILRSLHIPGWEAFPLGKVLSDAFHIDRIAIANDANAVALAEWKFGAGRGAESLLYLTVSTGIGGGLIMGGKLIEGATGNAGEIGHMKLVPHGPVCTCGRRGCLEALAAGPAIARRARERLAEAEAPASLLADIEDLTAEAVSTAVEQGDALAESVIREAAHYLGTGIANAINVIDVARVVVGGGVSRAGHLWWNTVQAATRDALLPWRPPVSLQRSELGSDEGVWGAAALVSDS